MTSRKIASLVALGAASVLLLAGCAGTAGAASTPGASGAKLTVVASTNVYGQIAQEIGGGLVDVTSIVSSGSQDPHGYEASAQDQLTISKADLIIENGAGYDAFVDALITSSGTTAPVINAAELSHAYPATDASAAPTASAAICSGVIGRYRLIEVTDQTDGTDGSIDHFGQDASILSSESLVL